MLCVCPSKINILLSCLSFSSTLRTTLEFQINMARPMVKHVVEETPFIYEVGYLSV